MTELEIRILFVAVLIPSVILHEISHGAVALVFGDDTAKRAGRLTLNPIPHIDPFGSIILPAILAFTSFGAFGYAKPVPVNPRRLRDPRNHSLLVSLAGPASNIALAAVAWFLFHQFETGSTARQVAFYAGFINVLLAAFNLVPIPPLDGSAMVERLLPARWWPGWLQFRRYSMGLLLALVLIFPGVLARFVFTPVIDLWRGLLLP